MREQLEALRDEALQLVNQASTQKELNDVRVKYLGKKGPITEVLRGMGKLSAEERPVVGEIANAVRGVIQTELEQRLVDVKQQEMDAKLALEAIDVTLPGRPKKVGQAHLLATSHGRNRGHLCWTRLYDCRRT